MNEAATTGSNALVLDTAEQKLNNSVSLVELKANEVTIFSEADYQSAAEAVKEVKAIQKEVTDYWEPLRVSSYAAYQNVLARKKEMLDPLTSAEKILKEKMSEYVLEQERIRKEQEMQMRKAAQDEAKAKLDEAIDAQENGDEVGAEYALAEAEVMNSVAQSGKIQAQMPTAKGVSAKKAWKITGIDSSAVPVSFNGVELRPVDEKMVMSLIKASKGKIQIPGITYEETAQISVRA